MGNLKASQIDCLYLILDYVHSVVSDICKKKEAKYLAHLDNVWLIMNSPKQWINIRSEGKPKPTKEGISIFFRKWDSLRTLHK
jgi:hypothetical protein